MNTMNITGKLHLKKETQQVTATFRKREFVLEFAENPEYPQFILFQLVQDRVELIDGFNQGDEISVSFNLRGRSWTPPSGGETKYFNSLEAWRIVPAGDLQPETAQPVAAEAGSVQSNSGPVDDLPF